LGRFSIANPISRQRGKQRKSPILNKTSEKESKNRKGRLKRGRTRVQDRGRSFTKKEKKAGIVDKALKGEKRPRESGSAKKGTICFSPKRERKSLVSAPGSEDERRDGEVNKVQEKGTERRERKGWVLIRKVLLKGPQKKGKYKIGGWESKHP